MKSTQTGFTLIAALFLLIVLALLGIYMINFSAVQHTTLVYGVQGARAMQAARSGLEWGVYESIKNNNCPPTTTFSTSGAGSLDNFNITVDCVSSSHFEGSTEVIIYRLTSSADTGTFGTLDYVFRRIEATVSIQPP
ncbi:MAG: pilus assembly protein MshP [Gammaproteobacteria bacterium]|nr:pilus assembly protein MshP [Gammaproteobacteria bacterium]